MSDFYDPALVNEYLRLHQRQELSDQDRFADFSQKTDGIELIPDRVLADSEEEFLSRPNVQMMRKLHIFHRSGALLNKDNIYRDRFAMQFSQAHGPLNAEDSRKLALILPHIPKALNVSRPTEQLFEKFRSILNYLDLLKVGVCILSDTGMVILNNREFQRQIEDYPVYRVGPTGKLLFNEPGTERAVRRLLANLSNHGHFGARPRKEAVTAILDGDDYRLCIEVSPLNAMAEFGTKPLAGHILYSLDTSLPASLNTGLMANLFGLTEAETMVLSLMAEGLTNREIAERRAKSVETINSQAKSILSKTMSANRTQLIRLATNLSANFLSASVTNMGEDRHRPVSH
jgi:DNA-binding CsgD family transcriptional regulator